MPRSNEGDETSIPHEIINLQVVVKARIGGKRMNDSKVDGGMSFQFGEDGLVLGFQL